MSGRKYTHGEVHKHARAFGTSLQQMGLKKGDVFAIALPNMPEYPIVTFGAWYARQTVTLVNPTYTPCKFMKLNTNYILLGKYSILWNLVEWCMQLTICMASLYVVFA